MVLNPGYTYFGVAGYLPKNQGLGPMHRDFFLTGLKWVLVFWGVRIASPGNSNVSPRWGSTSLFWRLHFISQGIRTWKNSFQTIFVCRTLLKAVSLVNILEEIRGLKITLNHKVIVTMQHTYYCSTMMVHMSTKTSLVSILVFRLTL